MEVVQLINMRKVTYMSLYHRSMIVKAQIYVDNYSLVV